MAVESIFFIEDLSKRDLEQLAQLLMVHPSEDISAAWLEDQSKFISAFSPCLTRPTSTFARLVMRLPFTPAKAVLCASHKPLNPHLIRRIFLHVSAECTTRLRYLKKRGGLDPSIKYWMDKLQKINSLWMSAAVYRVAFGAQPDDARPDRVESGCEACILSRIGGDRDMLIDLRIAAMSRKRKRGPLPRLLALLDEWVSWHGEGEVFIHETDQFAKKVRAVRRELQLERRQARKNKKKGIKRPTSSAAESQNIDEVEEAEEGDGTNEEDIEADVVDYYRQAFSTTNLLDPNAVPEGIHPAFRESMIFDVPPPAQRYSQSAYTRSVYSQASDLGSSGTENARNSSATNSTTRNPTTTAVDGTRAERHAQTYRSLVGISERYEGGKAERLTRSMSSSSNVTHWSAIYNQ